MRNLEWGCWKLANCPTQAKIRLEWATRLNTTRTQNFEYDNLNRLLDAYTTGQTTNIAHWGEVYTIDAWGNLTNIAMKPGWQNSETLNAAAASAQNQLNGFCYDAAGNMIGPTCSPTYVYDAENRLSATAGFTYRYDGDGTRVVKCNGTYPTCSSGTLYWTGAGSDTLAETNWTGVPVEEYVFFNGGRVARRDGTGNTVHYYFADHLGSTDVITGANGVIQKNSVYYPFGGEIALTAPSFANNYKFTGKERDSESGLDNFEARYLGSSLGRFMSPDPMGGKAEDPQSLNRYAYVRNSPLTFTDPSGMNFGLPCSGGNPDTCNNGLQGSWQHDQDGNKTTFDAVSIGNKDGTLQDVSSNKTGTYTASFDGSNVSLTNSGGTTQNGSWLQGTAAVSGVSGGGNLTARGASPDS